MMTFFRAKRLRGLEKCWRGEKAGMTRLKTKKFWSQKLKSFEIKKKKKSKTKKALKSKPKSVEERVNWVLVNVISFSCEAPHELRCLKLETNIITFRQFFWKTHFWRLDNNIFKRKRHLPIKMVDIRYNKEVHVD